MNYSLHIYLDQEYVGYGNIDIPDRSEPATTTVIDRVSIAGSVLVDSATVGHASGYIEDYVAYGSGGSRVVDIPIDVYMDQTKIGSANLRHTDNYAPVSIGRPPGIDISSILGIIVLVMVISLVINLAIPREQQ